MRKIRSNIKRYDGNGQHKCNIVFTHDRKPKQRKSERLVKYWVVYLIWGIYYFTYFGLQYSLFTVNNDVIWLNFSLFGFVELLGMFFASSVSKRMQRVYMMRIFIITAGCACLLNTITQDFPFINLLLFICNVIRRKIFH